MAVRKTTVYLPDPLKRSLENLAARTRRSEADLIREAIGDKVASQSRPRPTIPLVDRGLGDATAAERVDEILGRGFGRT